MAITKDVETVPPNITRWAVTRTPRTIGWKPATLAEALADYAADEAGEDLEDFLRHIAGQGFVVFGFEEDKWSDELLQKVNEALVFATELGLELDKPSDIPLPDFTRALHEYRVAVRRPVFQLVFSPDELVAYMKETNPTMFEEPEESATDE
jgi:hypothetical protein